MLSRPEKRSFKKVHKIEISQRGQSMAFAEKSDFLSSMYFGQIKQEKIVFLLFWIKKSFLHQKKKLLKKSKNSKFSKRVSPWFLSKNRTFCHVCLLGKSSQKRSFFGILDKKECFLDQKKEVLKNDKKSTFSKGVSPQFLSKN